MRSKNVNKSRINQAKSSKTRFMNKFDRVVSIKEKPEQQGVDIIIRERERVFELQKNLLLLKMMTQEKV